MNGKLHLYLFVTALSLLGSLTGCDERILYHSYHSIPSEGWERHDTLVFRPDTVCHAGNYRFDLELRATEKYPSQSVWLVVESRFSPPASTTRRDTVECLLIDPETHRTGRGIHTYQYNIPLYSQHLTKGEACEIRIRHCMHRENLHGLRDIGIRIMR